MTLQSDLLVVLADSETPPELAPSGQPTLVFRNTKAEPAPGEGRFVILCEADLAERWTDSVAAASSGDRTIVEAAVYEHVASGSRAPTGDGSLRAVLLVFSRCTDPTKETEFNDWYDRHIDKVIETTPFHAVHRYRRQTAPEGGTPQFLALWETDTDDLGRLDRFMRKLDEMRAEGKLPDPAPSYVEFFGRTLFHAVY